MRAVEIWALTLSTLISCQLCATSLPGAGINVQPLQSTIAEETFQTMLVNKALETLGYNVQPIKAVDYNVAYLSVAAGDATFLAVNWVPSHDAQYKAAGGNAKFYREGDYIKGGAHGYLIDKKTADKYHITNLAQLQNPDIAKLFDSNDDGKADLTGCNPGWGCEASINYQIQAYGLSATLVHNQGNYTAMIADLITRYKEGKPVLYYTWTPYWVSSVLVPGRDVVWLQVPFSALPDKTINTELPNGTNYGFTPGVMHIVANKQWAEANPVAAKLFAVMQLPTADINAQNLRMHNGEKSEVDIQRHVDGWVKAHQATFDGWVKTAAGVANGDADQ